MQRTVAQPRLTPMIGCGFEDAEGAVEGDDVGCEDADGNRLRATGARAAACEVP